MRYAFAALRLWLIAEREALASYGALVPAGQLFDRIIDKVDEEERSGDGELLTLTEAAKYSGYTSDHLGALVRHGKLHNYGRPNAPRIRRDELPLKVSHGSHVLTTRGHVASLKAQITREARFTQRGRNHG